MAARKSVLSPAPARPELEILLEKAKTTQVTDTQLMEQRISFAYGNAPENSKITRDSVQESTTRVRLSRMG